MFKVFDEAKVECIQSNMDNLRGVKGRFNRFVAGLLILERELKQAASAFVYFLARRMVIMNSDIAIKYRIKLGLWVALIITLMTFGVLWQNFHFAMMFLTAAARFIYVFAIWLLYFPISKRFSHKLKALFAYLLVCVLVIIPLISYHFWVSDITNFDLFSI
jgi:hypothetical protein